jgi:subtilisin-like proprotein convertase family protein
MHRSIWLLAALVGVAGVCLALPALAGATTFSNTGTITINDGSDRCFSAQPATTPGQASAYPSTISVSGLTGTVTDVNVTLTGLSHTFPDDVDVLLVGPSGQTVLLMSDTGGHFSLSGVNLTFDDAATASLSDDGQIVSGTYKPTQGTTLATEFCAVPTSFPSPAPASPYGSALSAFNGTNPNGTWSLYVIDDSFGDIGSISGGWSLDITADITAGTTPEEKIADLRDLHASLGIHPVIASALDRRLLAALDALAANNTAGACAMLQAFLSHVRAPTWNLLSAAHAQQLTGAANAIRAELGC